MTGGMHDGVMKHVAIVTMLVSGAWIMTGGMHDGVMKHVAIVTIYVDFRSMDHDRGYARRCDEACCHSDYLC